MTSQWKCLRCDKLFPTSLRLTNHNNRKYPCKLKNIVMERPSCTNCNKTYSRKEHLKRHMLTCEASVSNPSTDTNASIPIDVPDELPTQSTEQEPQISSTPTINASLLLTYLNDILRSKNIRVAGTIDNPLFVAADVGTAFEISQITSSMRSFTDEEKGTLPVHTHGGVQNMSVLTMKGLYRVLLKSKKPEAELFVDWVCNVIESIRTTGSYDITKDKSEYVVKHMCSASTNIAEAVTNNIVVSPAGTEIVQTSSNGQSSTEFADININEYHLQPCIYLLRISSTEYKFGKSYDIRGRMRNHRSDFAKLNVTIRIVKFWRCENGQIMNDVENRIKLYARINNILSKFGKQTEIIKTTEDVNILINKITEFIEVSTSSNPQSAIVANRNFDNEIAILETRRENDRVMIEREQIQLEMKRVEVEHARIQAEVEIKRLSSEIEIKNTELELQKLAFERLKYEDQRQQNKKKIMFSDPDIPFAI